MQITPGQVSEGLRRKPCIGGVCGHRAWVEMNRALDREYGAMVNWGRTAWCFFTVGTEGYYLRVLG